MSPRLLRYLHLIADAALVAVAWIGAYYLRASLDDVLGRPLNPIDNYIKAIPLIVIPWVASGWVFGLYKQTRGPLSGIEQSLKSALLGFLLIGTVGYFFREYAFGRFVVAFTVLLAFFFQGASRWFFFRWVYAMRSTGANDIRTLVLGAGTTGVRLLQKLQDRQGEGYRIVGFLDDDPALAGQHVAKLPVLGELRQLRAMVQEHDVKEIIAAIPELDPTRLLSLVIECEDLDVRYQLVTNVFKVLTARHQEDLIEELPLVLLDPRNHSPLYQPVKALIDVVGALIGIALTLPFWFWWALRIKLDSPGPVFFTQERVGKKGKIFRIIKFRTMASDTDPNQEAPRSAEDSRISRYGVWLRRTSIDELPNLLNVLKGEMSLVGPRPEMPFIEQTYEEWQRRRLTVKPGLTGLWQILGRKDLPMHDNLQYDFYYIHNRSLLLDISIMLRTVAAVLGRTGAF